MGSLAQTISLPCHSCDRAVTTRNLSVPGTKCPDCGETIGQLVEVVGLDVAPEIVNIVSGAFAREFHVLPLEADQGSITFVTCYPHAESQLIGKLRYILGRRIVMRYSHREELLAAIERLLPDASEPVIEIV